MKKAPPESKHYVGKHINMLHPAFISPCSVRLSLKPKRVTITCSVTPSPLQTISQYAEKRNFKFIDKSLGPVINLKLTEASSDTNLGYLTGALLPNRLHIESYKAAPRQANGSLLAVSPGMLLFIAALAHASQNGIPNVYGLAIDDAPDQHRRLVRYLVRFGGEKVMRVTDQLKCVPARVFYGGFGTVIRGDVEQMLSRGLRMLQYKM